MEKPNEFPYVIKKSIILDKPLISDIAINCIACPWFFELLYHGLIRFYRKENVRFAKDELLKQGDEYFAHQPEFEGKEKNTYKVNNLNLSPKFKSITIEVIKPSSKAAFRRLQMIYTYDETAEPKVEITFLCDASSSTPVNLMKIVIDQSLKRMQNLAKDPVGALKELNLITELNFKESKYKNLTKLPYNVTAELFIPANKDAIKKALNVPAYLSSFLPNVQSEVIQNNQTLSVGDECKIKFNNMRFKGTKLETFEEEITFSINQCGEQIVILSNPKVTNFHQIGFTLMFDQIADNMTSVEIGIHYNKSQIISLAKGVQKFTSFFTDKVPDPVLFLLIRIRSMLDTAIRHLNHHIVENLQVEISAVNTLENTAKQLTNLSL